MGFLSDISDSITGKGAQRAAKDAGRMMQQTAEEGADLTSRMYEDYSGKLNPYAEVGAGGLAGMQAGAADNSYQNSVAGLMSIANTPYQQTPGFQDASKAMSRQVMSNNAARGKLGSGNTLMDLFKENAMLGEDLKNSAFTRGLNTAQFNENALNNRFNRYGSLADMGFNAVNNQATLGSNAVANINNLRTGGTAANAAGLIGAQNARDAGVGNMIALASMAYGAGNPGALWSGGAGAAPKVGAITAPSSASMSMGFSDARLKTNINRVGTTAGGNAVYTWDWTPEGKALAGDQPTTGVIAQEVNQDAVVMGPDGWLRVDYARVL